VSGAIQFSDGSAFASDAANFFWDNVNKRLGVRTNTPTRNLQVNGIGAFINSDGNTALYATNSNTGVSSVLHANCGSANMYFGGFGLLTNSDSTFGQLTTLSARVGIKGSGSTSATTSLLVQNSAGTQLFKIEDGGNASLGASGISARFNFVGNTGNITSYIGATGSGGIVEWNSSSGAGILFNDGYGYANMFVGGGLSSGAAVAIGKNSAASTSSVLEVASTTKGFLPPRMTTTQKNAIASPAAGLVLYDSTTNKLQCYNGSTWNDLF
jgi:hypothetical protein